MAARFMELERRTLLVQFIAVEPLTFYATSDGTDLVQDILRSKLARTDANIFGQEGSLSIDDNGEFLTFEPTDTKNRTLHLPIEHLAYCGALRRLRRDPTDTRNPDQILKRDFENVDLANRYAHLIIGPPIFVAVFHGFDNALCYTFVTQSADDACVLVMKLMRSFRQHEQQLEQQGQDNQGLPPHTPIANGRSHSPGMIAHGNPLHQSSQALFADHRQILPSHTLLQIPNTAPKMYIQDSYQDDLVQRLLSNPNLQIVNQQYSPSAQHIDNFPYLTAPIPAVCYPTINPPTSIVTQQNSPFVSTMSPGFTNTSQLIGGSSQFNMRPPSPPVLNIPDANFAQSLSLGNTYPQNSPLSNIYPQNLSFGNNLPQNLSSGNNLSQNLSFGNTLPQNLSFGNNLPQNLSFCNTLPPQVVYKPNNQEVNYKQNVMVRWLKPPTPPPLAPIIIREIECPPEVPPPIVYRQVPPCPPTPPPIIVRERPPPCQLPGKPIIVEKRLPPVCLPRQVVVERCPPPPPKPQTIIYERYLPPPPQQKRQVIVQRETCQPTVCAPVPQPAQCRRIVREIVRQVPQQCIPAQPAVVCTQKNEQQIIPGQSQFVQQLVPVFSQRQHVVQPKGIRVIRQVIGPTQPSTIGQVGIQQQIPQMCSSFG